MERNGKERKGKEERNQKKGCCGILQKTNVDEIEEKKVDGKNNNNNKWHSF